MNKENVLKVADAIEQHSIPDLGFNMGKYFCPTGTARNVDLTGRECGTTACIAGWTIAVRDGGVVPADYIGSWLSDAGDYLGLHEPSPGFGGNTLAEDLMLELDRSITPVHAVAVLRHLAETGVVDWSVGAPK